MTVTDSELRGAAAQPDPFAANCSPATSNRQFVVPDTDTEEQAKDQDDALDFDWSDGETLVFRRQLAVAVYRTPDGGLVIHQEPDWNEEDDTYIVISPENVGVFIDRLTDIAGIPSIGGPKPFPIPTRKR
jgi:hypothetical protein